MRMREYGPLAGAASVIKRRCHQQTSSFHFKIFAVEKNMQRLVSLVVILCVAQRTLGQGFDCSTEAGQIAFLENGALTDPNCYNPILSLVVSDRIPTTAETEIVSETLDSSAQKFVQVCLLLIYKNKRWLADIGARRV